MDPLPDVAPAPSAGRKSALAFFAVLLALWLPGALAQSVALAPGLAWTELFVFLLSALVAAAGSNVRAVPYLRLGAARPAALALGALAGAAGYVFAGAILMLTECVVPASLVRAFDPARLFAGDRTEQLALAVVATVLAPACEEIAFRGYLQTTLGLRRRPAAAILGAAALFAVLHMNPVLFPALVALGAVFGWLVWRAGSIWPAVLAHAVNNAITTWLVLAGVPAAPGAAPLPAIASAFALGGAGLLAVGTLFRAVGGRAPPRPPVELRDPGDPSIRFSPARVPRALAAAVFVGAAALGGLLAAGLAGVRARP